MANRDYPLAPTYMNGGDDNSKKLRKQTKPSPDARKPKKDPVKRELTPQEMEVVTRAQKNKAAVEQARAKGVTDYNMKDLIKRSEASRDSVNVVMRNAWSKKSK